jgi:hypothetical protein
MTQSTGPSSVICAGIVSVIALLPSAAFS